MIDLTPTNIQDYWAQGIHVDSKGVEHNIADMPASYLQNVINKFGGTYDVTVFQDTLNGVDPNPQQDTVGFAPTNVV